MAEHGSVYSISVRVAYIRKMHDNERRVHAPSGASVPSGFAAIGVFLFFGATMASLAGISLFWRGTSLDRIWSLNPAAYRQLAPLGRTVGILFVLLGAALAAAGIGWFRRRLWGWKLRSRSSLHRLSAMSLTASGTIGSAAELASSSPERCCCSSCVQ